MGSFAQVFAEGDFITRTVALLLLAMSVSAWVLIFWKGWTLVRARRDLARGVPAFWAAPSLDTARTQLAAIDRELVLMPLLAAALHQASGDTLEAAGQLESQLTRRLRDALHVVLAQLQYGQVLLASIGATAPFIGLFGTVWGILNALTAIGIAGQASIDKVAGPVGEALIMTAFGLAVAVPAVMGYNWLIRRNKSVMEKVRAFSGDLHNVLLAGKR
jgi:biopolymer transport protein ExbB